MERWLPPLIILSFVAFVGILSTIVSFAGAVLMMVYFPILALTALFLYKFGIKPSDPRFPATLFLLAFMVKLLGSAGRYWMVIELYNGSGDSVGYHMAGRYVAQFFKEFDFSVLEHFRHKGEGTTNFSHITGFLFTVLPPSLPGSFLFFATLAFAGSVFFYLAFLLAFPESKPGFYRLIIFFLPSVLFWPSSLGKDAWIFFCSGLIAYGLAKYLRQGRFSGVLLTAFGILSIYLIRPQVAVLLTIAIVGAFVVTFQKLFARHNPILLLTTGALIVGIGVYGFSSSEEFRDINGFSIEDLEASYEELQGQTSKGDAIYETQSIFTPRGLILGIVTVLFRPFPWEAHNAQSLVTALEAFVWLWLVWARRAVFWRHMRSIRSNPWLAFVAIYVLIMILGLTTIGNFAILARQRTLLLPFFWILFA